MVVFQMSRYVTSKEIKIITGKGEEIKKVVSNDFRFVRVKFLRLKHLSIITPPFNGLFVRTIIAKNS